MAPSSSPIRLRSALFEPLANLDRWSIVLVSAPGGSGKTTLLAAWRDRLRVEGRLAAKLSISPLHEDPGLFVEDLVGAVREALGERDTAELELLEDRFGAELLRRLATLSAEGNAPASRAASGERLARRLLKSIRDLGEPVTLLVDDGHCLPRESIVESVMESLLAGSRDGDLSVVFATRGRAPRMAARLVAEGRALELGAAELSLRADQIAALLVDRLAPPRSSLEDIIPLVLAHTGGWAMGVLVAIRALARRPEADPRAVLAELGQDDSLFGPLAEDLLSHEPTETLAVLEQLALLGPLERETATRALEDGAGRTERLLHEIVEKGYASSDGSMLSVHPLWQDLLLARLRRRTGDESLAVRVRRCVELLEDVGRPARAAELAFAFGLDRELIGLLERHGLALIERGQHANVARWLSAVRPAIREHADLELLAGLLDARSDPTRALATLERAAIRFHRDGRHDRELATLHNIVIVAGNEGRREETRAAVLRLLGLRRLLTSAEARGVAVLFATLAAFQRGRYRIARSLVRRASGYALGPRERGALAMGQVQLSYLAGGFGEALASADAALCDPQQRSHGPSFYTLRALRAFCRGVLGRDRPQAFVQLNDAREAVRELGMRLTEAECGWLLARLLIADGRAAEAVVEAEHALAIFSAIGEDDGETASQALLAHASWLAGDAGRATHAARAALACFEEARRRGPIRFRSFLTPLAARVLAEQGDLEQASRFAQRCGRFFEADDVPLGQQTAELALARVTALAGDAARSRRHLARAARATARLDSPAPELDAALLGGLDGTPPAEPARLVRSPTLAATPRLSIETFGGLDVVLEGQRVAPERWRGQTTRRLLLRLLCAEGRPIERERLATELWPEADPARARGNLRVGLSRLRRVFEPEREAGEPEAWLELGSQGIALASRTLASWDVRITRDLFAQARAARQVGDVQASRACMRRALALQRGPLAPDAYDDWVLEWRSRLEEELVTHGREAATDALESAPEIAGELAEGLVERVPGDEGTWVLLVRSWVARGDRATALRSIQRAREALRRALDLEASPALDALVDEIRSAG